MFVPDSLPILSIALLDGVRGGKGRRERERVGEREREEEGGEMVLRGGNDRKR